MNKSIYRTKFGIKLVGRFMVDFLFVDDVPVSRKSGNRQHIISRVPFPMKPDN
jgi:hypothetical protein